MSQSDSNNKPRVLRSADTENLKNRILRSSVIDAKAKNSPYWTAFPELASAGLRLIQAGIDLDAGEKAAEVARTTAVAARQGASTLRIGWDDRFGVYAGHVESVAVKPEDVTNLGCLLLDEATNELAPPLGVSVKVASKEIRVWVHMPPGAFGCRIEVSPDPVAPGSYVHVKGKGVRRALAGYAPGKWWIRAASVGEQELSSYTQAVMVVVPS